MPHSLVRGPLAILAALAAPLAVCAVLLPLRSNIANTNIALILVVAVVAAAILGHRLAGALSAVSAALWFDFFFTRPYEHFSIAKSADITTAVLLLVVGLAVSQVAARARRLQVIAVTDADYLARIHHTARLAQSATSPTTVVDHVRAQLVSLLHLSGCRFEYGTLLGRPARLEQEGSIVLGRNNWDVDQLGLPDGDVELRVFSNGHYYGRFMLEPTPGPIPSLEARLVAVTLADQAGATLYTMQNSPHPD
ncbi:DUF4118 domain-containing protein [Actinacidiphila oryziradicis]|uniref:DUF4118 domain-containing protein n=1 Tax=Actinacidiphila oryziradicis TaxID=2571141 RepID=A0A4V5MXV2_9ACTN|nr:DUF4118 domain-containing protein [Actinacidiphila oryziradicis]TKA01699.1 DUF4118 domain-containing protein [Actinacidiphila oryziradicis]